jgi:hypothetical protein
MLNTIFRNVRPLRPAPATVHRERGGNFCRAALLVLFGVLPLQSCTYNLPVVAPTSTLSFRLIATDPTQYTIHVDSGGDHKPADDGKLTLTLPAYRPSCSVYLLGVIKVGGNKYPEIQILKKSGKIVRTIAIDKIKELPMGNDGYRLLKVK